MRHLPKYLKMLLVDCSPTRKLLPKCFSVMLYLGPNLPWECSKIDLIQQGELQRTESQLRCTNQEL